MHLVGYLYEDYHDARSLEHKTPYSNRYIQQEPDSRAFQLVIHQHIHSHNITPVDDTSLYKTDEANFKARFSAIARNTVLIGGSQLYMITLLYLVCPDLVFVVVETSYGIQVRFIESHVVFTIRLFISLFVSEVHRLSLFS